jgi:Uma2 family endonuclease
MPISKATYERVALEDPEGQWELVCGRLRSKPGMATEHNRAAQRLHRQLVLQLDERDYAVSLNASRLRISSGSYYIPDLVVIPDAVQRRLIETRPGRLEIYDEPMPLVVEVWSPSTGDYDVEEKLIEYQRRGDLEIWRIHPYAHTLTIWRRLESGEYERSVHPGGRIPLSYLPGVTIDLDRLFD